MKQPRIVDNGSADAIAERCRDAYSADRYGEAGWRGAARMLARNGLTGEEIEAVLRSKWTRWAGDLSGKRYGRVTGRDLERAIGQWGFWSKVRTLL